MADGNMPPEPINNFGKIQYSRAGRDDRGHERPPGRRVAQSLLDALPEPDGPIPDRWTPDHVGRRLIDAFRVLDRMPKIAGPKGASTGWPEIERSAEDRKGWVEQDRYEELVRSAAKPTRLEMTRMENRIRMAGRAAQARRRHGASAHVLGELDGAATETAGSL